MSFLENERVLNFWVWDIPHKRELEGLNNKHVGRIPYASGGDRERKRGNEGNRSPESREDPKGPRNKQIDKTPSLH